MPVRSRAFGLSMLLSVVALFTIACDSLPSLPGNPFAVTPTLVPSPVPTATLVPTPVPSPTAIPFRAFWVKNFRPTDMWSGPGGQDGVISFGMTSQQFCSFQVVKPQEGSRLYVLNPFSKDYFWIDADAVGPVPDEPQHQPGPKPADQNCAEVIYDE